MATEWPSPSLPQSTCSKWTCHSIVTSTYIKYCAVSVPDSHPGRRASFWTTKWPISRHRTRSVSTDCRPAGPIWSVRESVLYLPWRRPSLSTRPGASVWSWELPEASASPHRPPTYIYNILSFIQITDFLKFSFRPWFATCGSARTSSRPSTARGSTTSSSQWRSITKRLSPRCVCTSYDSRYFGGHTIVSMTDISFQ